MDSPPPRRARQRRGVAQALDEPEEPRIGVEPFRPLDANLPEAAVNGRLLRAPSRDHQDHPEPLVVTGLEHAQPPLWILRHPDLDRSLRIRANEIESATEYHSP